MVETIRTAIEYFARFLSGVILVRVILSWLPVNRNNGLIRIIYSLTEPILGPIRSALRKSPLGGPGMMLDFSPIIAMLVIEFVKYILLSIIK